MNIGNQISAIRKEQQLTQEQFGSLFHVTRQTVSNWENEKSYPDLQMLIDISNRFEISLDTLIKEDSKMVKAIDKERVLGKIKKEKSKICDETLRYVIYFSVLFLYNKIRYEYD